MCFLGWPRCFAGTLQFAFCLLWAWVRAWALAVAAEACGFTCKLNVMRACAWARILELIAHDPNLAAKWPRWTQVGLSVVFKDGTYPDTEHL
jgi:hypothetical protein